MCTKKELFRDYYYLDCARVAFDRARVLAAVPVAADVVCFEGTRNMLAILVSTLTYNAFSGLVHRPPMITRHGRAIICKKAEADDEMSKLLGSLNAGMNSWSDFADNNLPADNKQTPKTKNAGRQKTKRKGKDGKLYLRDGPKRPAKATKLAAKRKASADSTTDLDAAISNAEALNNKNARVRIEESKAGGKKLTIIRGLESMPSEQSREILKGMKQALAVGGRVTAQGQLEIQGSHAEMCMLRLQKAGFTDVKLAGGAGNARSAKPAWNAPKEVRELAETRRRDAKRADAKAKEAKRNAARAPSAVAAKMLDQLRASEQQEVAKLRRSDLPKAEKRLVKEKLARIQQRIAEAS